MTAKRFMIDDCGTLIDMHTRDTFDYVSDVCGLLNEQHETIEQLKSECKHQQGQKMNFYKENEELKQEVEMLRNGLKAYGEALPLYLDCEDIMHFNNELFDFEMERMDFYKKYPNRIHYK